MRRSAAFIFRGVRAIYGGKRDTVCDHVLCISDIEVDRGIEAVVGRIRNRSRGPYWLAFSHVGNPRAIGMPTEEYYFATLALSKVYMLSPEKVLIGDLAQECVEVGSVLVSGGFRMRGALFRCSAGGLRLSRNFSSL